MFTNDVVVFPVEALGAVEEAARGLEALEVAVARDPGVLEVETAVLEVEAVAMEVETVVTEVETGAMEVETGAMEEVDTLRRFYDGTKIEAEDLHRILCETSNISNRNFLNA
ncbi:hypothetical protein LAZ67_14000001 [Cordylochernes scorpioides]|uniref:Uncharacterized protein n=1 Tax=Cordylochernes scorpioides TaxID=51811 RepID=A0ABY6L633_9ARAC|nr:hypothetical protein LAZ67_14000001 [Cordylochernes scorpioides]